MIPLHTGMPTPVQPWFRRVWHRPFLALAVAACLGVVLTAQAAFTRADADAMLRKVAVIAVNGLSDRPSSRRTPVSENEVNAFLEFHAKPELPAGLIDPLVTIDDAGRVSGRATVDLDEVKANASAEDMRSQAVLQLLRGRVPVDVSGVLSTTDGIAHFQLESAHVSGMPVPKSVVQQVIAYYSRTTENPAGIDIDAPFPLPARIRGIELRKGEAVIVQ
jgi:hypothetical protein